MVNFLLDYDKLDYDKLDGYLANFHQMILLDFVYLF